MNLNKMTLRVIRLESLVHNQRSVLDLIWCDLSKADAKQYFLKALAAITRLVILFLSSITDAEKS